jgi:hypothetical protein
VIVPSKMDSPIWGMTTSVGMASFHSLVRVVINAQNYII